MRGPRNRFPNDPTCDLKKSYKKIDTVHPETDAASFVTEADWIPDFWNFLLGLDANDLIAELVQNDFDQQATETVISFKRDHLLSEGNGNTSRPGRAAAAAQDSRGRR